jgi:uncharacterized membrane protein YoaK (UPF0700 family)
MIRDALLHALTVSSGAVDAISFFALGKVFSAFMTGNIAFLGLRIAGAPAPGPWAILVALGGFALGVYVSARIVQAPGGSGLWPRRVTAALGASLIPHSIFQMVWFAGHGRPSVDATHVLLALWGLAMGMQSAAVRTLRVEGVFTTAATATVIDLMEDITTWSATVAERRRLFGVLVSLFIGATAGGLLLVHGPNVAPVLPFAITAAVVTVGMLLLGEDDVQGARARESPRANTPQALK